MKKFLTLPSPPKLPAGMLPKFPAAGRVRPFLAYLAKPGVLRRIVRESQPGLIAFCLGLGVLVGLMTLALHDLVLESHRFAFGLASGVRLGNAHHIDTLRLLAVPCAGGLLLGIALKLMKWWRPGEIVDPIEANAVYGGRMSLIDSLRLLLAALLSNAAGASVGMEAAYTQLGGGLCSRLGAQFQLRRADLRVIVAAGTAAAIAAAYNAPLAGAFYAFELVLGLYTVAALPHVAVCALASVLTVRLFTHAEPLFSLPLSGVDLPAWDYPLFVAMGAAAALIGIITMKLVTRCERLMRELPLPDWMRPAVGGLLLGLLALPFPQVLGSGQGGIDDHLHSNWGMVAIAALLAAKILGSAISIGAGFRGGLFSASLFIGCLFGQICGIAADILLPQGDGQVESFMLVGMGAVAASIVGAPVTMVMLVLEMTGSFTATTAVMAGVVIAAAVTRYSFGYSFSTWRFHLRGLRISGAHDVGWVREMTVRSLMQDNPRTVPADATLESVRAEVPAGTAKRIFVTGPDGRYLGAIDVSELHGRDKDAEAATTTALDLARGAEHFLLPRQNIREALTAFAEWQTEELPVLESDVNRWIVGWVTEPFALKSYTRALEAHNLAQSGAGTPDVVDAPAR
jgi:CIC family chloride channel protein